MRKNSVSAAVMTAPGKFEVRQYPYPAVSDDALVIELEMCGICGTDKHTFRGETTQFAGTPAESHTPFPIIPGHEIVGKVAEVGKNAAGTLEYSGKRLAVGDRVVMCPDILCGKCYYCRNTFGFPLCENIKGYGNAFCCDDGQHLMGGWADYIYVRPDAFVFKVPDDMETHIAVMAELMSVTYNLDKAKELYTIGGEGFGSGATVLIQGVGPMGLMHVLKAHILGAGKIIAIDRSDFRLQMAKDFGADDVISLNGTTQRERVQAVRDLTEGRGADVIVECTGEASAIPEGMEMVRRGGTYVVAGVYADVRHPDQPAPAFAGQPDPPDGDDQSPADRLCQQHETAEQIQKDVPAGKIRDPRISGQRGRKGDGAGVRHRSLHEGGANAEHASVAYASTNERSAPLELALTK